MTGPRLSRDGRGWKGELMTLPEFEDPTEQPRPKLRLVVLGARTGSRHATVADLRAQLEAMTAEERHEVWETAFPREIELLSERDELSARLVEDNHALRRVEDANAALQDERDRLRAQVATEARHRNALQQDLNHITEWLQTIADETCGPFPAQSSDESMERIEVGILELRDRRTTAEKERDAERERAEKAERERDEARAGESSAMRRVGELADASPEGQGVTVGTTEAEVTRGIKVALMTQVISLRSRCTNQRRELRRLNAALSRFRGPLRKISWEGSGLTKQRLISALLRRYDSLSPKAAGEAIDDFLLRSGGATIDAWRPVVEAAKDLMRQVHSPGGDGSLSYYNSRDRLFVALDALPPEHRPKPDPGRLVPRRPTPPDE